MKRLLPILLLPLAGCVATDQDGFEKLRKGSWIEAKGRMVEGKPVVDEIDELERSESDKADKIEVTGQTTASTPTQLELLGLRLQPDKDTEYEDADKKKVDRFVPATGEWLRVKLRNKDDEFKLRTVRKSDAREQFKVEGEIVALDAEKSMLSVGGIQMPLAPNSSVTMLGERAADDPLALFKADDQKGVPFSIRASNNLFLGGGISGSFSLEDEFDLDRTTQRDRTATDGQVKADALWLFDDKASYAMLEVEAGRADTYVKNSPDRYTESAQVTRAVASIALGDGLQLLVGRQDFDEEREWLFDEVLDGVRLIRADGPWRFEAGAAMGRDVGASTNDTDDTAMFEAMARYFVTKDWALGAYVLQRKDQTVFDHEPLLYGLRSIDEPRYGLGHWAELGFAAGHSRRAINDNGLIDDEVADTVEDIDGWAFDIGALWQLDAPLRPAFAIGYAFGSGERDSASTQGYRQTLYNDNNGKLGGVTSVRYYGELLRPELSNVAILTVAAAFRPIPRGSISVLFHTYTQDYAAQSGPRNDLRNGTDSIPNGVDPDLGYELDVVFGYRTAGGLTIDLVGARFEPGPGFNDQDSATKLDLTARFSF